MPSSNRSLFEIAREVKFDVNETRLINFVREHQGINGDDVDDAVIEVFLETQSHHLYDIWK